MQTLCSCRTNEALRAQAGPWQPCAQEPAPGKSAFVLDGKRVARFAKRPILQAAAGAPCSADGNAQSRRELLDCAAGAGG